MVTPGSVVRDVCRETEGSRTAYGPRRPHGGTNMSRLSRRAGDPEIISDRRDVPLNSEHLFRFQKREAPGNGPFGGGVTPVSPVPTASQPGAEPGPDHSLKRIGRCIAGLCRDAGSGNEIPPCSACQPTPRARISAISNIHETMHLCTMSPDHVPHCGVSPFQGTYALDRASVVPPPAPCPGM